MKSFMVVGLLILAACAPAEETEEAPDVYSSHPSSVAFRLPERDLFPEGIAYDPASEVFFIGSLRKSKIVRIDREGVVETLVGPSVLGMGGILGMRVDPQRRILWANFHQSGEQLGSDPSVPFRTGIHSVDLETGKLLESFSFEKENGDHLLNDIALAEDGTVYMTSYSKGSIYRILPSTGRLEEWVSMPEGVYTNGIDMEPGGRFLFVAGNEGIYRIEIDSEEVTRVGLPEGEFIGYGDGLYYFEGSLVVIASFQEEGALHYHVLRMSLSDDLTAIETVRVLDRDHPLYAFPTTGTVLDGWFYYLGTAQFDKVDQEGTVAPWDQLSDILVFQLDLGE